MKHEKNEQPEKMRSSRALKILAVLLCVAALVAIAVTGKLFLQYRSRIQALSDLRDGVYMGAESSQNGDVRDVAASDAQSTANSQDSESRNNAETAALTQKDGTVTQNTEYGQTPLPTCSQMIDFSRAHATNQDIYAWITVPGTDVDYPILQSAESDDYYLLRNLDGSSGYPGCLYTNASCNNQSFTDRITVVYGHNMPQGGMFTSLHNFEDQAVFDENETFTVYTEQYRLTYELVAAVWYNDDYIPYYFDTNTSQGVLEFWNSIETECDTVNEPSIIKKGVEITDEDRLCVLSTCCRRNRKIIQGRRYLVIGRLIETALCE